MEKETLRIGRRIREARKSKRVTLVELSQMTGVAQATLSRIETGVMRGTVESHQRIAEALGMSLSELYSEVDDRLGRISSFSLGKRSAAAVRDGKVKCEILTQHAMKKKITPLLLTLEGRGETEVEKFEAGVEKFYFVLEGEVTARIEKKEYPLTEGETLYFDASLPHQLSNASGKKARVFCAVSPPAL